MDKVTVFEIGNAGGDDTSSVEMMENPILVMINLLCLGKGSVGGIDGIGNLRKIVLSGRRRQCLFSGECNLRENNL